MLPAPAASMRTPHNGRRCSRWRVTLDATLRVHPLQPDADALRLPTREID